MNIFVGNIAGELTEESLKSEFERFGGVDSVKFVKNIYTGYPQGYGFVEMADSVAAHKACTGLNGKLLCGKKITVAANIDRSFTISPTTKKKSKPPKSK
jgi:cold-inducible RNA-binding protein